MMILVAISHVCLTRSSCSTLLTGGVKVVFDVGFQREEVNTPNINVDFANTQVHVATIRRSDRGRRVFVQVLAFFKIAFKQNSQIMIFIVIFCKVQL